MSTITMKKSIQFLFLLFVFLLPVQTQFIYQETIINAEKYQFETQAIFGTELLLGLIVLLTIISFFQNFKKREKKFTADEKTNLGIFAALLSICAANCFFADNSSLAFYKFTQLILGATVAIIAVTSQVGIKKICVALAASGVVQAIFAVWQFATQSVFNCKWLGMAAQDPAILGTSVIEQNSERLLRAYGTMPHPNLLAGFLTICLLATLFLITKLKGGRRIIAIIGFAIIFLGLLLTFSRAGLIAFFAGFAIWIIFTLKNRLPAKPLLISFAISIVLSIVFGVATFDFTKTRIIGGRLEQISTEQRLSEFQESTTILNNDWLTGSGLGNYTLSLKNQFPDKHAWEYQPPHNAFWLFIIEFGVIQGAIILLTLFGFIFWAIKSTPESLEKYFSMALATAWLILAGLDHYFISFWTGIIIFGLIMGIILNNRIGKRSK